MTSQLSGEERTDPIAARIRDLLMESGNCAQTAFAVLQESFAMEGDQILRALTPLPGLALRGETCGAVTGCLMALGLEFGRDDLTDWRGYIGSLPPARRFLKRFEEEIGHKDCAQILEVKLGRSYDLADRTEAREYASSGGPQACVEVVSVAVRITSELIAKKRRL